MLPILVRIPLAVIASLVILQVAHGIRQSYPRRSTNYLSNEYLNPILLPNTGNEVENFETLFDYARMLTVHRNVEERRCFIEKGTRNRRPVMMKPSSRYLTKSQIRKIAGPMIQRFCQGYRTMTVNIRRIRNPERDIQQMRIQTNIIPRMQYNKQIQLNDAFSRSRRNAGQNIYSPAPRGRYRGQTQSQYLNTGGESETPGRAEAESTPSGSRAVVSGKSGMGQAQSQSGFSSGCEGCDTQTQGLVFGRGYPAQYSGSSRTPSAQTRPDGIYTGENGSRVPGKDSHYDSGSYRQPGDIVPGRPDLNRQTSTGPKKEDGVQYPGGTVKYPGNIPYYETQEGYGQKPSHIPGKDDSKQITEYPQGPWSDKSKYPPEKITTDRISSGGEVIPGILPSDRDIYQKGKYPTDKSSSEGYPPSGQIYTDQKVVYPGQDISGNRPDLTQSGIRPGLQDPYYRGSQITSEGNGRYLPREHISYERPGTDFYHQSQTRPGEQIPSSNVQVPGQTIYQPDGRQGQGQQTRIPSMYPTGDSINRGPQRVFPETEIHPNQEYPPSIGSYPTDPKQYQFGLHPEGPPRTQQGIQYQTGFDKHPPGSIQEVPRQYQNGHQRGTLITDGKIYPQAPVRYLGVYQGTSDSGQTYPRAPEATQDGTGSQQKFNSRPDIPQTYQPENQRGYPETTDTQKLQQPYLGTQHPYPGTQQPYPGTQQPYPGTQQPYPGTQQPYPGTQQPYPGISQQYPKTQQPYSGTQQPYPGTQQPYPGNQQIYQNIPMTQQQYPIGPREYQKTPGQTNNLGQQIVPGTQTYPGGPYSTATNQNGQTGIQTSPQDRSQTFNPDGSQTYPIDRTSFIPHRTPQRTDGADSQRFGPGTYDGSKHYGEPQTWSTPGIYSGTDQNRPSSIQDLTSQGKHPSSIGDRQNYPYLTDYRGISSPSYPTRPNTDIPHSELYTPYPGQLPPTSGTDRSSVYPGRPEDISSGQGIQKPQSHIRPGNEWDGQYPQVHGTRITSTDEKTRPEDGSRNGVKFDEYQPNQWGSTRTDGKYPIETGSPTGSQYTYPTTIGEKHDTFYTQQGKEPVKYDDDDGNSQAETNIQQTHNGTQASASSTGTYQGGSAQSQISGSYSGTGSFSAQAQTIDANRGSQSQISVGKNGVTSSAQGRGGQGQSQAQLQLGSDNGATVAEAQSGGRNHGTNTQVQASAKGGLADAQANGPGSTSSQAQIGFQPYQEGQIEDEKQESPFYGGGSASAQSGAYTGQSQTQIQGKFKYGISYNGAAQAGSGSRDGISKNRTSLKPLEFFGANNVRTDRQVLTESKKDTTAVNTSINEGMEGSETKLTSHTQVVQDNDDKNHNFSSDQRQLAVKNDIVNGDPKEVKVIQNVDDYEDSVEDDYDGDFTIEPAIHHLKENNHPQEVVIQQTGHGQKQHIVLGSLEKNGVRIVKDSSDKDNLKEGMIFQPGEVVPGTQGYTIPIGFRGRVSSVSQGDETFAYADDETGDSQAQTITLTPGSGNITYASPSRKPAVRSWDSNGSNVRNLPTQNRQNNNYNLRSSYGQDNPDSYVTVTKSITGELNKDKTGLVEDKKFSHTYYTKSSTCGYFTFTCNLVYGSNGRTKICKPQAPTNPDGSPVNC